jgi:uncharacterized membrane protein YkgB
MNALIYKGNRVADWLGRRSVDILRVSLGLIFLGFGVLKFFPGASPAEALVMRTVDTLTFPGAPTLEAQYVLKDVVLAAAGLVVAVKALTAMPVRIGDGPGRA